MDTTVYTPLSPLDPTPSIRYPLIIPLTPLETSYSLSSWRLWFSTHWFLSVLISVAYVVLIFAIQLAMKNRRRFELRKLLTCWNFALAIFSLGGTLRTWPEMGYILWGEEGGGWWGSCCSRNHHNVGAAFWGLLFTLSKAVELGDTIFIVLRKQPLIFLHWYHHITVLTYTWYTYPTYDATSRWFMVMNFPVHALMYSYYGLKSLHLLPIPRPISMLITLLQLSQMVLGVVVNVYAVWVLKFTTRGCVVKEEHLTLALVMYASYFALFAKFFWGAYGKRTRGGVDSGVGVKVQKVE